MVTKAAPICMAWLGVYGVGTPLVLDMLHLQSDFFSRTADFVPLWVGLLFLNIPMQLVVMFAAALHAISSSPRRQHRGGQLATLSLAMILVHIIISTLVWFRTA
jgi:hypothetical protein